MKKILLPVLLACATLTAAPVATAWAQATCPAAPAKPVVEVPAGIIATSTTWTNDNIYLLKGFVYVDGGATLTIQPGTIIKGDKAGKGTLIIRRGSKIMADGTATQPIVFTSNQPAGMRNRGDWGGVILLGSAPNNVGANAQIEGGVDGLFGGTNPADNSGVMRYVRIEFPGVAFQPNNEINGLTFGGVGSGTTIDYVQVSYSGDDSYEWFGGTVNCKHLIALRGLDDEFDTDNGFSGKVQYGVALRDPAVADVSGSNGFESDNDATGTTSTPQTSAVFSNMSIFLPGPASGLDANYKRGMHLRRNTAISIFNTVITGYPTGILLDGSLSEANATNGSLVLKNNVLADMGTNFAVNTGSTFDLPAYFNAAARANTTTTVDALLLNAENYNLTKPNFLPQSTSPLLTGAAYDDAKLADAFFDKTGTNRGAFGTTDWTAGWANFDPQNTCYNVPNATTATRGKSDQVQQLAVYPNPSAGAAKLSFGLRRGGTATVRVVDALGRQVALVLDAKKLGAGQQEVALPTTLKAGIYIATVATEETTEAVRFVVTK